MPMKVCYTVVNGIVMSENRNGVISHYSHDPSGNTIALRDSAGNITDTFEYFPSGTVAKRTGTNPTPFLWNGGHGYYQDTPKRVHVRERNFYVNLGRWAETDPIGFKGGDYNLYRYVKNRFVTLVDPTGLYSRLPKDSCVYEIKESALGPVLKTLDFNPLIREAVESAKRALVANQGKCAWKCALDFIKTTINPSTPFGLFMDTYELYDCLKKTLSQGKHRCDLTAQLIPNDQAAVACEINSSKINCAHSFEETSPFGPTTWCLSAFDDLKPYLDKNKRNTCNAKDARIESAIHEAFHICSPLGFTKDNTFGQNKIEDPHHNAIIKAAICMSKCK